MGARDVHGAGLHRGTRMLPGCYKATVNESETITEAQQFCAVRCPQRVVPHRFGVSGQKPIEHPIERS